uniref:Putative Outer membrane efflux protein n=1 Tax=mine drainage metagenome TaxID=410659 RepID=E6Q093_9ZZZZ
MSSLLFGQGSQPGPPMLAGPTAADFRGSAPSGQVSAQPVEMTLEDAVTRGLKNNLGMLLSNTQSATARGERLQQLQALLPNVDASATEALMQVDLAAEGLRIPGFPTIIGPFGYTDLRANLNWTVVSLSSLHNYLATRHNFQSLKLTAEDAKQMVILTVGNAYLVVVADQARVDAVAAQVATAKISLDQATARHDAGTAPKLDGLRAQVDYQNQQQLLIVAQNQLEKDKLVLARCIGLPLDQKFDLVDKTPYAAFDQPDVQSEIRQALANRKDRQASAEQTAALTEQRKAATADRLPTVKVSADYGDIGVNVRHSHGTGDASGTLTIPIFKEAQFRGEAQIAQSQLDQQKARQSDLDAQIEADIRDALLDIAAAEKQVEVSRSNVDLAREELSEAQQRYAAGVSDNLAVSEAQQSMAQADGTAADLSSTT